MVSKNKTYLVLNYCSSPVCVDTRNDSYIIPGGSAEEPASMPFPLEEIMQINSNSPVFKYGILWFEEEFKEDIYNELRIRDWQNILTDTEIERVILNPEVDKLERILAITSEFYFERIYGIYVGLKNANASIPENVKTVMTLRKKEFRQNKKSTEITLRKSENTVDKEKDKQIEDLKAQLEALQKMVSNITAHNEQKKETVSPESVASNDNSSSTGNTAKRRNTRTTKSAKK